MKYLSSIMTTIERENDVRIIFSDCSLTILKEYAISFIINLEKHIEQSNFACRLNDYAFIKAFVYLTLKQISKRSDLCDFGIIDIKVNEL